jgi:predicted transcriptional regulator
MAEILSFASEGATKTQLMYKAGLSYAQLKNYTSMLVKLNLLMTTTKGKAIVYQTTEKGKSFLERYEELSKLLK